MQAPDPIAFTIFGLDVMWYGVLIACAMGLAVIISCARGPLHGIESDKVLNFCLICIPVGVVGARLYYVLFNLSDYAGHWWEAFMVRSGGLAIHGGLIFAFLTGVILCRFWDVRPFNILDLVVPTVALAQSIGRWGNFFNAEAHGGSTDLPWAIVVNGEKVHPTFLYESVWCFLLFFVLLFIDNRRKFEGQTFLLYAILYSVERFFVEGLRTDSLMLFGFIKQAQFLSAMVIICGLFVYIYLNIKSDEPGFLGRNVRVGFRKPSSNIEGN